MAHLGLIQYLRGDIGVNFFEEQWPTDLRPEHYPSKNRKEIRELNHLFRDAVFWGANETVQKILALSAVLIFRFNYFEDKDASQNFRARAICRGESQAAPDVVLKTLLESKIISDS